MSQTIVFSSPPIKLASAIGDFDDSLRQNMANLGEAVAADLEAQAKAEGPWNDRTGDARKGLTGLSRATRNGLEISLAHTVDYGPYLELKPTGTGGRPIILPIIERNARRVFSLFAGLLG